jgi:hypothetical protein
MITELTSISVPFDREVFLDSRLAKGQFILSACKALEGRE